MRHTRLHAEQDEDGNAAPARGHTTLRAIAVGLFIVVATYAWFTNELPAHLAESAPATALIFDNSNPAALVQLADAKVNRSAHAQPDDSENSKLSQWAAIGRLAAAPDVGPPLSLEERQQTKTAVEAALRRDPLNASAFAILGRLAEVDGDSAAGAAFMQAAVKRSAGSTAALYWLVRNNILQGHDAEALSYADILLRKRPQLRNDVFPVLAYAAERSSSADFPSTEAQKKIVAMLAADPGWRTHFFAGITRFISDARTPLLLMTALKDTDSPPTADEINGYLRFLVGKKLYAFAYYVWLQFLEPTRLADVGFLTNGSFETGLSGAPFDWTIQGGKGVTIDTAERIDAEGIRALYLEFGPGRAQFRGVDQIIMLTPGSYSFTGRLQGELSGRRGLLWRVSCLPNRKVIAETQMFHRREADWAPFEAKIDVPVDDCEAQELRLMLDARSASEELISGSVWYDALSIRRITEEEKP